MTNLPSGRYTADEMMTVATSRALAGKKACFVGIGLPSSAANLARRTHSADLALIYESGCLGSRPTVLPDSIGDGILAETATSVVSVPEMFNYWLQPGRIELGLLGAAQIDKRANINTTVIGDYAEPTVRLPGAGGAPEIASSCGEVIVVLRQSPRTFVERVSFVTSVGFGSGKRDRRDLGLRGAGPTRVITDLCELEPNADGELEVCSLHPGTTVDQVRRATGWDLRFKPVLVETAAPTETELDELRLLNATRTTTYE